MIRNLSDNLSKIVLGTDSEIEITDSVGDGTDVLKSLEKMFLM